MSSILTTIATISLASSLALTGSSNLSPNITSLGDIEVVSFSYMKEDFTYIKPKAQTYELNPETTTGEVKKFGFTPEQVNSARKFTTDKLVQDYINSPGLNNNREKYISFLETRKDYNEQIIKDLTPADKPGVDFQPIIPLTTPETSIPVLGTGNSNSPIMGDTKIVLKEVNATEFNKSPRLIYTYEYDTAYKVTDDNALNYVSSQPGITRKQAEATVADKIFEPGGINWFKTHGKITFTVQPKNTGWEITELSTNYIYDVSDFMK